MKKKVLVISLIVAAFAIVMIGGSLAWFMDDDEVANVFTVGSIDIVQEEDFVQNSQLLPVLGNDPTDPDDHYVKKIVRVSNTGKNDAYVQTYVAIPSVLDNNGVLKMIYNTSDDWEIKEVATDVAMSGETIPYDVYRCRYTKILGVGQTTSESLKYVYIDPTVDLNVYDTDADKVNDTAYFVPQNGPEITSFNAAGELHVYVATQGVQARGFAKYTSALDTSFAEHPWE